MHRPSSTYVAGVHFNPGYLPTDPRYRKGCVAINKGKKYPPEPLTVSELHRMVATCTRRPAGIRNRALIVLLWRSGLRIAEALDLYPKDIDLRAGTVSVLHGKGDERRLIGVDAPTVEFLHEWIERRAELGIGDDKPFFCTVLVNNFAHPMNAAYVREMVKDRAEAAGIRKRVHPHGLRHTHAFELANESVPLHIIRRQLGHKKLSTTERYIDHLNPAQVVRAIHARPWVEADGSQISPPAPTDGRSQRQVPDLLGRFDDVGATSRRTKRRRASHGQRSPERVGS